MSTYTDIRYDYNLPSGFGGGLTLLQTNTITSGVASSSFTSGIDSSYRTYMFKFINIHPQTNDTRPSFNFSTDGGSSYNVTKTTTVFRALHNEADNTAALNYRTDIDIAQGTGYQQFSLGTKGDADSSISGQMFLFSPSSTTFVKHFILVSNDMNQDPASSNFYIGGYGNTTSAIDAIDFKMSSGNIDSGVIKMYGIA